MSPVTWLRIWWHGRRYDALRYAADRHRRAMHEAARTARSSKDG